MIEQKVQSLATCFVDGQASLRSFLDAVPADDRGLAAGRAAAAISVMDEFMAWAWYYTAPKSFDPTLSVEEIDDSAGLER